MQPQPPAYIAIGVPGTNPTGPGTAECSKCRTRKPIALSTATTIFDLKAQGITTVILCWSCLELDDSALAAAKRGIGGIAELRNNTGLDPLDGHR